MGDAITPAKGSYLPAVRTQRVEVSPSTVLQTPLVVHVHVHVVLSTQATQVFVSRLHAGVSPLQSAGPTQ